MRPRQRINPGLALCLSLVGFPVNTQAEVKDGISVSKADKDVGLSTLKVCPKSIFSPAIRIYILLNYN